MILAIETSCDDTCAAVVSPAGEVHSNVISSQGIHDSFGGVVPEIAARQHLELIDLVVSDALVRAQCTLDEVNLIAATQGPGLLGALLVGLNAAKGLAAARELPFAPVDHLRGHVAAAFLAPAPLAVPFVSLIASGGHTLLLAVEDPVALPRVLRRTLDDAAGEAFDKGARMLGLGYPGGAALERLAADGDPEAFSFPTGRSDEFSFSGLKTALLYKHRDHPDRRADLAASYQSAIVEALLSRTRVALEQTGYTRLAVGGGVAANGLLRARLSELGVELSIPSRELCTDNAAMIAGAARFQQPLRYPDYLALDAYATGEGPLR
ncbi:MAG: tRNA (adenosine(37)-N6)-threonylcarbamoyltransferase complex transferase subunit TsaD [Solirubrobacteraceae bacterium]